MASPSDVMNSGLPWAAAITAVGHAMTAPPVGPSAATGGSMGTSVDTSGWNVNYGDGTIDSTRSQTAPTVSATGGVPGVLGAAPGAAVRASVSGGDMDPNTIMLIALVLVAVKVMKRKRSA